MIGCRASTTTRSEGKTDPLRSDVVAPSSAFARRAPSAVRPCPPCGNGRRSRVPSRVAHGSAPLIPPMPGIRHSAPGERPHRRSAGASDRARPGAHRARRASPRPRRSPARVPAPADTRQTRDFHLADAVGRVDAESVSGDVTVTQVKGDVRVEGVNGTVTVSNVDGDVGAETVSGGIALSRVGSKSVRAETVAGRIGFNGKFDPAGSYSFKSHAGALTIGVPANTGATVSLETFNGSVESDFPVTLESGHGRRGHESRMEFRIGDGRSRIVLETFSGSIRIERSTNRDDQE